MVFLLHFHTLNFRSIDVLHLSSQVYSILLIVYLSFVYVPGAPAYNIECCKKIATFLRVLQKYKNLSIPSVTFSPHPFCVSLRKRHTFSLPLAHDAYIHGPIWLEKETMLWSFSFFCTRFNSCMLVLRRAW